MVRAGVRAAGELAALAIEETGFGVFEDKVVKNYVATEFLSDYLRDKRSVGVIEEDAERDIVRVAEPIGVVLAITPVTNPTSTVLYKAIVAAKTRNAILFRPSPYAMRSCERSVEILREAAEAAGMPPGALQVIPDADARGHPLPVQAPGGRLHLGHRRPEDRGPRQRRRQARPERRPGQRADLRPPDAPTSKGAVVDILISKTFDASVICPAEQTCIVDDEVVRRDGRGVRADGCAPPRRPSRSTRWPSSPSGAVTRVNMAALGQQAPELARPAGLHGRRPRPRSCSPRCPPTSTSSAPTRWCRRS